MSDPTCLLAHLEYDESKIPLRDYWFVVLKRRWMILAVVMCTWVIASIATFLQTPRYRATSLIQVDNGRINLVEDVLIDAASDRTELYATQEKILKSGRLAERVVEQFELETHPLFRNLAGPEGSAEHAKITTKIATKMLSMLRVSHIPNTQLMEVSFLTPDPELSARVTNELVQQYIDFTVESESGVARNTVTFIRDQIEELQKAILEKERALREYSSKQRIVMAEHRDENIVIQRLEELNRQLTQAEAERAAAVALYKSDSATDPAFRAEVRNSAFVQSLRHQLALLREKKAELSSKFKPDWPEMQRLDTSLGEVERSLDREIREEARKVVGASRAAYIAAMERERLIRQSLEEQKQAAQDLNRVAADYEQIKAELDNQRQMLQVLLRRRSETNLSADLGERQPVRVKIVEEAKVPEERYTPNAPMNLLVGAIVGLILAISLAFLIEYLDDSVSTIEDLRHVPLPSLGMIPRYAETLVPAGGSARLSARALGPGTSANGSGTEKTCYLPTLYDTRVSLLESRKILDERFKFLRGSLLHSLPGTSPKTVLVTSPDKSCGKTFVTCNLGVSLVQLNKRVLLVDADLRNPNLHRVFKYRNKVGLTSVLTGQKSLNDGCVMKTEMENLFLLMAGPMSPTPAELLASPVMDQTLQACAIHFDYIVLDSAPLLPVFDTHSLSTKCDAVLLVSRSGITSRHAIKTSLEHIQRVSGRITGVVLNDVDLEDFAQYYYHSRYTYEYRGQPIIG